MVSTGARVVRRRGKRVPVNEDTQREIVRLSGIGHSLAKISELTGFSRWTVDRVLKEGRSTQAVERERRQSTSPQEVVPVKATAEVDCSEAVRVLPDLSDLTEISAVEISTKVSSAVSVAQKMVDDMTHFTKALEELWERAERAAQMEVSLTETLETFRLLRLQLEAYRAKIDELETKNAERAMAVHSESSLVQRKP